MVAQASPNLEKVVVKLLELSEDEESRMIYEAEVKAQRDDRARMRGAYDQGKNEKALEIASNLIDLGMPVEKIAQSTGLPPEEIEKLRTDTA
jgi:predicted transposase/invertase (TIGR01784 family)